MYEKLAMATMEQISVFNYIQVKMWWMIYFSE